MNASQYQAMRKQDISEPHGVKDDSLSTLNMYFLLALAFTALIVIYALQSQGVLSLSMQSSPSVNDFWTQIDQAYKAVENGIREIFRQIVDLVRTAS
jgi:hypothetical protein